AHRHADQLRDRRRDALRGRPDPREGGLDRRPGDRGAARPWRPRRSGTPSARPGFQLINRHPRHSDDHDQREVDAMSVTTERPKSLDELVERYNQAWGDHDLEAILALQTPDSEFRVHGAGELMKWEGIDA